MTVRAEISLFLVWRSIDLVSCVGGRDGLGFWMRAANRLVLV